MLATGSMLCGELAVVLLIGSLEIRRMEGEREFKVCEFVLLPFKGHSSRIWLVPV